MDRDSPPRLFKRTLVLLLACWTLFIAVAIAIQYSGYLSYIQEHARVEARSAITKDILFRRWASLNGGVYVPVTKDMQPNPYLDVPDRDLVAGGGKDLTLVNPAYMTRLVHELGKELNGVQAHLTSLDPIRPQNAPDEWESGALRSFEKGNAEVSSIIEIDGAPSEYVKIVFAT